MKLSAGVAFLAALACVASATQVTAAPGSERGGNAAAVQIRIDARTGRKISGDDGALETTSLPITVPTQLEVTGLMPVQSLPGQLRADGSMSAVVGLEHHKFMTLTIDEQGNRIVEHKSYADIQAGQLSGAAAREEQ